MKYDVGGDSVEVEIESISVRCGERMIAYVDRDMVSVTDVDAACAVLERAAQVVPRGSDDEEAITLAIASLRTSMIEPDATSVTARHIALIGYGASRVIVSVSTAGDEVTKVLAICGEAVLFCLMRRDDSRYELVHRNVPTSVVRDLLYRSEVAAARRLEDDFAELVLDD